MASTGSNANRPIMRHIAISAIIVTARRSSGSIGAKKLASCLLIDYFRVCVKTSINLASILVLLSISGKRKASFSRATTGHRVSASYEMRRLVAAAYFERFIARPQLNVT
jgi:hypothetical protein